MPQDDVLFPPGRAPSVVLSDNNNMTTPSAYDPLLEDPEDRYWGLSDRDVPILIGAAAGAIGLVLLIVGAIVIWYCCQFAFKNEKSVYSLDYDSDDRGSVSSEATMPFSESTLFAVRSTKAAESSAGSSLIQDIRRSQSAPLNVSKLGLSSSRGKTGCGASSGASDGRRLQSRMYENMSRGSEPMHDFAGSERPAMISGSRNPSVSSLVPGTPMHVANPVLRAARSAANQSTKSRSHLYSPSISQIVDDGTTREIFHLSPTATNAAWRSIDEEDEVALNEDAAGQRRKQAIFNHNSVTAPLARQQSFNLSTDMQSNDPHSQKTHGADGTMHHQKEITAFSKKRKNRMLRDSAAAIALRQSGNQLLSYHVHDDRDCLVQNQSVVVFDERTAL